MQKRLFSGIQPSGSLHLGNYLGAIQQWVTLQDEYEAMFCVVDLHAITTPQDPAELRKKTLEIVKMYLAAGIDPKKSTLFVQSHVPEHTELMWILNTITKNGDLTKMTQFKDKTEFNEEAFENAMTEKAEEGISELNLEVKEGSYTHEQVTQVIEAFRNAAIVSTTETYKKFVKERFNAASVGLFDYPVLMAADILLYDAAVVPVGEDQVQHIELTRTLARRFNERFGETFAVPESRVMKEGARIMGLDDPTKKMSKSAASEYNYIALTDDAETVRKKIRKAVTDSGTEIVYSDDPRELDGTSAHGAGKPALRNLINIYSLLANKTPQEIVEMYKGKGYSDFKNGLAEVVAGFLAPFQERLKNISDEEALAVLKSGAQKASERAGEKMLEVKKKVGFLM